MNSDSGSKSSSCSGTGFGSVSNRKKLNTKVKKVFKNPKLEANFLGKDVASNIKKERFCTNFSGLDPVPDLEETAVCIRRFVICTARTMYSVQ
jgi:hypothetical protein